MSLYHPIQLLLGCSFIHFTSVSQHFAAPMKRREEEKKQTTPRLSFPTQYNHAGVLLLQM